ncbi:putative membrane protein [Methylobacterium sp. RAS18]|nr:putative membrane protein [Methylobacterium sp. RAS18]
MSLTDEVHEHDPAPMALDAKAHPVPAKKRAVCAITGVEMNRRNLVPVASLRPALAEHIRVDYPDLSEDALISNKALAGYRTRFVAELLAEEHGEYSDLDRQVAESIAAQDTIAENIEEDYDEHRSFGERVSDGLAAFGGSWGFLISFALVLVAWMAVNVTMGQLKAFDPYPFILLNLVLSCLAAIQAPIIMMSQSRQDKKDRLRSNNDYRVNLKAELEIRHLHEKMDHLVTKQWQRLAEIQQIQLEMLQEMRARVTRKPVVKVKKVMRKKRPKATARPAPDPAPSADAAPAPGAPPPGPAG